MKPLFLSVLLEAFEDPTPRTRDRESFRRPRSQQTPPPRARLRYSLDNPPEAKHNFQMKLQDPERYAREEDNFNRRFIRWGKKTLPQKQRRDARIASLQDQERRKAILAKIKHDRNRGRTTAKLLAQYPDPNTRPPAAARMIRGNTGRNRAGPGHPNYDPGYGSLSKKLGFKIRDPEDNK